MVNMITKGKEKPSGKTVLLFSGGMDSMIFDHLLKPDVLLYLPTGSKYEYIETKKSAFDSFIETSEKFKTIEKKHPEKLKDFILSLIEPNVDASDVPPFFMPHLMC